MAGNQNLTTINYWMRSENRMGFRDSVRGGIVLVS